MYRYTLAVLFALFFAGNCHADDSIWLYKKAFVETYHLDRNCPIIQGKKVISFSLADEDDNRTKMRQAIQLADNCTVCHTPDIRRTKDSRLESVLSQYIAGSFSAEEEEDSTAVEFTDASLFDNEIIAGLPEETKVTSTIFKTPGHRFKMLEVKKASDERLVGGKITCQVINSRKSNIMGTEGMLIIRPLYITLEDGTIIKTKHDDIYIRGRNRQTIKFWMSFLPPMWFIPGEGAKIRPTDEFPIMLDL